MIRWQESISYIIKFHARDRTITLVLYYVLGQEKLDYLQILEIGEVSQLRWNASRKFDSIKVSNIINPCDGSKVLYTRDKIMVNRVKDDDE
jgi:hypothetical protein